MIAEVLTPTQQIAHHLNEIADVLFVITIVMLIKLFTD